MQPRRFFEEVNEWAKTSAPVFVVGPERSGTSLLFQLVSNHPAFCDFSEATVETFCFSYPWHLLDKPCANNYEMRLYLGQKNWDAFQESVQFIRDANNIADKSGLPKEYLYHEQRQQIWEARKYGELLKIFFYFSCQNLGSKRLVEKTPAHVRSLPEIYRVFPKAKVLVCTREPSEIVASHRKRFAREVSLGVCEEAPEVQWLNRPFHEITAYLSEIDEIIHYHLVRRCSLLVVPYRQITEFADETMQSIFEYVEVEQLREEVVFDKDRPAQLWDPLLNSAPQHNRIEVSSFLSASELTKIQQLKSNLGEAWQ
ncbi:sulfotransferase [Alteromonas sp. KUL49]|uniref:sulfotransferase family protein n=1 Tax=Alteromonas sp. KUL49 TaxID=2480798 RepID=UPI00102EE3E7|nr:sulfotransferase [Alteromonas sp. KUL49]TAP37881.1 sulfotransferase [Alteromonas sp. KUL49]GEA12741.1 hypothetical protein KUL49_31160 [Alteromonas sp. KUL49]